MAHNNLGIVFAESGKIDAAIKQFSLATRLMPEFIEAHINLASSLLGAKKFEKSVEQCRRALKLSNEHPELFIVCGDALSAIGKEDEARINYETALRLEPDNAEAHNHFGAFLLKTGSINNAIHHFQAASTLNPHDNKLSANLNTAKKLKNRLDAEMNEHMKQLERDPLNPDPHLALGHLFNKTGNTEAAIRHFQKAIDIDPELIPALNALAFLYESKKRYGDAVLLFKKIISINMDHAETYYNIACIYAKQNKVSESLHWLSLAIEKGYNNWELIKSDGDLDNIRNTPEYKMILTSRFN